MPGTNTVSRVSMLTKQFCKGFIIYLEDQKTTDGDVWSLR